MYKRILAICAIGAFFIAATGGNYDTNAKIKAIYIYQFTKYIEWPEEYRKQKFVIGILGDSPLMKELKTASSTKKINGQPIEIKSFTSTSDISQCHILYVPGDKAGNLTSVVGKIKNYSTLLVTDKPGLAKQGSAINFVIMQNRQKFELNESNAVKYKLKVSNSLEALAILVN